MTFPSSFNVSGLLGGTAGQIDTTTLISNLMTAQAIPQTQLKDQLSGVETTLSAYQAVNTKTTALQTAAQALTDPTAWTATAATSSSTSVAATSDGTASVGSTTFDVTQLARAQVSTVVADSSGNVVADPTAGITITGADGTAHQVALTSGSASSVSAAINAANVGVRASVVTTDQGSVLQLIAAKTGASSSFTATGFGSTAQNLVTAQDAKVSVGNPASGGYSVSSSSNTFTGFIPGVTFSVSAPTTGVTITVNSDEQSISNKVQALVTASNTALTEINGDSSQGAVLQGKMDVRNLASAIMSSVSAGTTTGASLKTYGIDIDKNGVLSFDVGAFAAAYAASPSGTKDAISGAFATNLNNAASDAITPVTGSVTQSISAATDQTTQLNKEIDDWTSRLSDIQAGLTAKYAAMETALSKLQSQQTYLTSMLKNLNSSSSSDSSS